MKYLFLLIISAISFSSAAQQITYEQWKEDAKKDINLIPEYGNMPKSSELIAEDEKFIKTCLEIDSTRKKSSEHMVALGFKYLSGRY